MYLRLLAAILLFVCLLAVVPALHIGESPNGTPGVRSESMVYISSSDGFYHDAFCPELKSTHQVISLADAQAAGYHPCPRCEGR